MLFTYLLTRRLVPRYAVVLTLLVGVVFVAARGYATLRLRFSEQCVSPRMNPAAFRVASRVFLTPC